ncbi:MAG: type II toxin-antitoxin system VapC family toxin [Actinomycetota bacterium]
MTVTYVESSALAKLIVAESGSKALRGYLRGRTTVTSALTRLEVTRAVRKSKAQPTVGLDAVFGVVTVVEIQHEILRLASVLEPPELRSLDAIHLATALSIADDLDGFVTYDRQLGRAATAAGLAVASPR